MKKFLIVLAVSFMAAFVFSSCNKNEDSPAGTYPSALVGAYHYQNASAGTDAVLFIEQIAGGFYGYFMVSGPTEFEIASHGSFNYDSATGQGVLKGEAAGSATVHVQAAPGTTSQVITVYASKVVSGGTEEFVGDFNALPKKAFVTGYWTSDVDTTVSGVLELEINNLKTSPYGTFGLVGGEEKATVVGISDFYYLSSYGAIFGRLTFKNGTEVQKTLVSLDITNNTLVLQDDDGNLVSLPYYSEKAPAYPPHIQGIYSAANSSTGGHGFIAVMDNFGGQNAYVRIYAPNDSLITDISGVFTYNEKTGTGVVNSELAGSPSASIQTVRGTKGEAFTLTVSQVQGGGSIKTIYNCTEEQSVVFNDGKTGWWGGEYIVAEDASDTLNAALTINSIIPESGKCGNLVFRTKAKGDTTWMADITGISKFVKPDGGICLFGVFGFTNTLDDPSDRGYLLVTSKDRSFDKLVVEHEKYGEVILDKD